MGDDGFQLVWAGPPVGPTRTGWPVLPYSGEVVEQSSEAEQAYAVQLVGEWHVTAALMGNEARYANHSCQPNCVLLLYWDEQGRLSVALCVRPHVRIDTGDELTIDYGWTADREADARVRCLCRAPRCRGRLYADATTLQEEEELEEDAHDMSPQALAELWDHRPSAESLTLADASLAERMRIIEASINTMNMCRARLNERRAALTATPRIGSMYELQRPQQANVSPLLPDGDAIAVGIGSAVPSSSNHTSRKKTSTRTRTRHSDKARQSTCKQASQIAHSPAAEEDETPGSSSVSSPAPASAPPSARGTRATRQSGGLNAKPLWCDEWCPAAKLTWAVMPGQAFYKSDTFIHEDLDSVVWALYSSVEDASSAKAHTPVAALKLCPPAAAEREMRAHAHLASYSAQCATVRSHSLCIAVPRLLATTYPREWSSNQRVHGVPIVTDWAGQSIASIEASLPAPEITRVIAFQALWATIALHSVGIAHGDVQAKNVCLRREPHRAVCWLDGAAWAYECEWRLYLIDLSNASVLADDDDPTPCSLDMINVLHTTIAKSDHDFTAFRVHAFALGESAGGLNRPASSLLLRHDYFLPLRLQHERDLPAVAAALADGPLQTATFGPAGALIRHLGPPP
jgi:hypothetical protein